MKEITIEIPTIEKQRELLNTTQNEDEVDLSDCDNIIPNSWKPFNDGFAQPSAEEIRKTFGKFSSTELANMLGLADGRIIRRWKSGENQIPYAAWRLFLILTDRVIVAR